MTGGSSGERTSDLGAFETPYGKRVVLQEVAYESGMVLLRVRIQEGSRFTILELDPDSAARWGGALADWAARQQER
jgi:hypothetical protein